jgi:hypothetical protein
MSNWIDQLYRAALATADSTTPAETAWLRQAGEILPEVAQLLPKRPPGAKDCRLCKGTGYIHRDATGRGVVCPECGGLGWKPL